VDTDIGGDAAKNQVLDAFDIEHQLEFCVLKGAATWRV
jgi:hypothetical protein